MNRVDRLMAYLLLFQSRGLLRAQDFAQEFEISERTVYRDIQALCEVGVPIVALPGEGYRLMEGYYLPPITFSAGEARSLYLAISMLTGLATAGRTQVAASSALEKIRAVLPVAALRQVEALQAVIHFYAMPGLSLNFDDKTLLALQDAIQQRRVVHLRYHAQESNEVSERDVEPLELAFMDKTWFLSAYCRLRQGQRLFRLERIDRLILCDEHFPSRPFDLERFRSERTPFSLTVRFDPAIVRWVKERQHYTWVEERPDASATLMIYRPRSFEQIEGWLLSWGDKMEVLEPASLRKRLADTAARIQLKHQSTTIDPALSSESLYKALPADKSRHSDP